MPKRSLRSVARRLPRLLSRGRMRPTSISNRRQTRADRCLVLISHQQAVPTPLLVTITLLRSRAFWITSSSGAANGLLGIGHPRTLVAAIRRQGRILGGVTHRQDRTPVAVTHRQGQILGGVTHRQDRTPVAVTHHQGRILAGVIHHHDQTPLQVGLTRWRQAGLIRSIHSRVVKSWYSSCVIATQLSWIPITQGISVLTVFLRWHKEVGHLIPPCAKTFAWPMRCCGIRN